MAKPSEKGRRVGVLYDRASVPTLKKTRHSSAKRIARSLIGQRQVDQVLREASNGGMASWMRDFMSAVTDKRISNLRHVRRRRTGNDLW